MSLFSSGGLILVFIADWMGESEVGLLAEEYLFYLSAI
jgi:hypothetical protein